MKFIGRKKELKQLHDLFLIKDRRLVTVIGRRGVGKSRLNDEFQRKYLNNDNVVSIKLKGNKNFKTKKQIDAALKDLGQSLNKEINVSCDCWYSFFNLLLHEISENEFNDKKIVLLIDEFAWMHTRGSGFVESFANFYDKLFNKNILIVITASAVSWMNRNVIKTSGGLHGKTHKTINLKAFDLEETVEYLKNVNETFSFMDLVNYYFYTGGIVRYLEKINPARNLIENVKSIYENGNNDCQTEFEELFYSIFEGKTKIHKDILLAFKKGNSKTKSELSKTLKYSYNAISDAVDDLTVSNILMKKQNYGKNKKEQIYFLTDLFCYFYIKLFDGKVINYSLIDNQQLKGFAFEIVVLLNIDLIKRIIGRNGVETKVYSWRNNSSQIDIILDYGKETFSLIEVKFYNQKLEVNYQIMDSIINKKNEFLSSVKKINKEMDVVFVSLLGSENKDGRLNYIDVCLKDELNI